MAALARLYKAMLVEVDTPLLGPDEKEDCFSSAMFGTCVLHARDGDGEFFMTVENTQRDVLGCWDVPKPEIKLATTRPERPATERVGKGIPGGRSDEVIYQDQPILYKTLRYNAYVLSVEILRKTLQGVEAFEVEFAIKLGLEGYEPLLLCVDHSIMQRVFVANTVASADRLLSKRFQPPFRSRRVE